MFPPGRAFTPNAPRPMRRRHFSSPLESRLPVAVPLSILALIVRDACEEHRAPIAARALAVRTMSASMSSLVDLQHIGWLQLTWTLSQAARVSARVFKGMAFSIEIGRRNGGLSSSPRSRWQGLFGQARVVMHNPLEQGAVDAVDLFIDFLTLNPQRFGVRKQPARSCWPVSPDAPPGH